MILDSSVLMAILKAEPEYRSFIAALADDGNLMLSAGSWIELAATTSRAYPQMAAELTALMRAFSIRIVPVTAEQARIGHEAYREFGKAHHRARLNFGDCFAYALAKATGEPLLFKGDDFNHTDLHLAPESAYPR